MRVLRGRTADPESDHRRTRAMVARVAATDESAIRVWTPHRQVVFGRRDTRSDGYERATRVADARNFHVRERSAGGRAVAFTGGTLAFVLAEPVGTGDERHAIRARYDRALDALEAALIDCGVRTERGEPPDSFCPGSHSLRVAGGKVVGLAQRVRRDVTVVGGVVVVRDAGSVARVLEPVYDALDVPFDPESVGEVASVNEDLDPARVGTAVEAAFFGNRDPRVEVVRET